MKPLQDKEIGNFFSEVEQFLFEVSRLPLDKEREAQRYSLEKQLNRFRCSKKLLSKQAVLPTTDRVTIIDNKGSLMSFTRARSTSLSCNYKVSFSPLPKLNEEDDSEQDKTNNNDENNVKPKQELKIPKMYVLENRKFNNQIDFRKFIENGERVPAVTEGRARSHTFPLANINADELAAQRACTRRKPDSSYIRFVSSLGLNGKCTHNLISSEVQSPKKNACKLDWRIVSN